MEINPAQASTKAFNMLVKPTGAACNLDCSYCFYLPKETLYPDSRFRMEDELLELYIRQLFEAQPANEVTIAWQGGEPTLMGLDFFKRSVDYAEQYRRPGQKVSYSLQTNGTLIDQEWAAFFKEQHFLIGLSLDGPQRMHDAYRVNKGGKGSFDQVMRGWEALCEQEVDTNILCTLHAANGEHPLEVYHFFRDELKAEFIQFIPIVERVYPEGMTAQLGNVVSKRSIKPEQYGRFLNTIFDEWVRRDVGKVFVQIFDEALGSWMGIHHLCVYAPTCGQALALEHNGDLYACDHFVDADHRLGNIREARLADLVDSPKQTQFGKAKQEALPHTCRECEVRFACNGGCPKDRFSQAAEGEPGLNYLCEGYRSFFGHIEREMRAMAGLLRQGRAAAEVMDLLAFEELTLLQQKLASAKPEDPCPCGSGKKFRACHGRTANNRPRNTSQAYHKRK